MCKGQACELVALPENNFMPTVADIEPHIQDAVLLCLCTPQNPTGTTLDKESLESICDLVIAENKRRDANAKKLYVLFDQMYFTLCYKDTKHYHPVALRPEMKAYTITIDGISKSFAATGVRVGWALGPEHIIGKIKALLSHMGAWAPMAEQVATAAFLQNHIAVSTYLEDLKSKREQRLWRIYEGIMDLKQKGYSIDAIAPQAAIYLTLKFDLKGMSYQGKVLEQQADVTNFLLDTVGVALVPFNCFGADADAPWYRMSVGVVKLEDINTVLHKLEEALKQLV
jgi:aspartate aminotransferase